MLFFPPFLGGKLLLISPLSLLLPFSAFCMASSATYICNDILDRENDLNHPDKSSRPIPSGRISVTKAVFMAFALAVTSILLSLSLPAKFISFLVIYFLFSLAYSFKLKEYPILDIFCVSAGFLLRLQAGGEAFGAPISEWLFLSVFLLSIFLSTGKRLGEKNRLGAAASNHRKSLSLYPQGYLEGIMYMTGGSVLVTYTLYVITRHSAMLLYTVPLCCFGLLRYILRVQSGKGGDPTESLTRDVPLFIAGSLWAFMVGWGIYGR